MELKNLKAFSGNVGNLDMNIYLIILKSGIKKFVKHFPEMLDYSEKNSLMLGISDTCLANVKYYDQPLLRLRRGRINGRISPRIKPTTKTDPP